MNKYYNYDRKDVTPITADAGLQSFFQKVYTDMAIALMITASSAFLISQFFAKQVFMFFGSLGIIAPLILVGIEVFLIMSITKNSIANPKRAFWSLLFFSLINGLTLSSIFIAYTKSSIAIAFVTTAAMFIAMAAWGIFSKKDMSGFGPILFGLLIGLLIGSLVNIFLNSDAVDWMLTIAGVLIFTLYTAYDHNQLKNIYLSAREVGNDNLNGLAITGALTLYLDFLNLFIYMMRLLGVSNSDNN